ncbi:hypothetical protein SDC9_126495 [bioreactor metagenome]|uniref:Uncharacterized protein n=1 Tax=bioreactor metagenome TaxID=1076179 RepID=A0A645CRB2_9ZZZZ
MDIFAVARVIHRVERADDAAHRFRERTEKVNIAVVRQEAVHPERFPRDVDIRRVPAALPVGIARRLQGALIGVRGLDDKPLSLPELMRPVFANLVNHPAKLVPDHDRVDGDVVRYALVRRALLERLIARHAKAVRNDLAAYAVVADGT